MEAIKIEALTFTYPKGNTPALSDISLSISTGELVCLCGKSGCGKSTLLRCLKTAIAPFGHIRGAVYFNGRELSDLGDREQAEKIGFVMQNPDNQIVCDKVWHEFAFGLENLGCPANEIRARVAEMASFFGIQGWYYKNVNELSGGQKQLLNLASVMVMQPQLLILDEPTSQLDPIAAHDFLDTVAKINRELGTTVILSEHRLEEALPLADRVIVMEGGRIIAEGDVKAVGDTLKALNNDMLFALPTPMRVYYSAESNYDTPVTIREGRRWLEKMPLNSRAGQKEGKGEFGNTVLKISEAWFRYEKSEADILKGVSLQIRQGEFYALAGGNGVGKSTLLSAVMGVHTPYRGRIETEKGKKIAALPQNPGNLFVKKTVMADLADMAGGTEDESRLHELVSFCGLENVLDSHPMDLSGGELQRAALAKVLLTKPDILLLDEPTKGLDAHFKIRLGNMLKALQSRGVSILMVSHDIEFCAKYADRIGMFFDGAIVSEGAPREFFAGKSFYTTAANRMARSVLPHAVLDEDIIEAIGGNKYVPEEEVRIAAVKEQKAEKQEEARAPVRKNGLKKRTLAAVLMILLLIPVTILAGMYFLEDRRYYFISLLIISETMLPFFFVFEGRKPKARELVIISVLCAIAVAGRVAFAAIPYFKPAAAIIIIAGVCFGGETGFLVGAVTAFASNFYFTQGPWTPWQMFAYGMLGFLGGVLFKKGVLCKSKAGVSIFGFVGAVVIYGLIMNISTVLMSREKITLDLFLSTIALGLPFDLIHGASTAFFLWLGFKPMSEKLERIKDKYGM